MAYFLFLLVNATLFLRQAELVGELEGIPLYEYLILTCAVFALPEVLKYLGGRTLEAQPISLCVFGLLGAVLLAQLPTLNVAEAWRTGFHFLKVLVYYLLLV